MLGIVAAGLLDRFVRIRPKAPEAPEAKLNLAAIRTAELAYFEQFGVYVSASPTPPRLPQSGREAWPLDPRAKHGFNLIGWAPEGQVRCQYAVFADGAAFTAEALCAHGDDIAACGYVQPAPGRPDGIPGPFRRCDIRGSRRSGDTESYALESVGPCEEESATLVY